ncbi:Vesicle-associated membrane protein-associated protein A [Penicillium atrosanguineum]|uniref:Vesicle-associated membrane protein-associated protein A n=1 Tax=Penicillium atrosanguineum TaxID=1132637 RepID=UPI00238BFD60|nr:Vesicle-associated membrane protein-associated protein A [Penicillium atrosanguineum]KAJ5304799.1 Vesicle-associated membrane protein-associated protein A [Penicillium atrosanguineum]
MSDPTNPNIKNRSTQQWGLYQRENFQKVNQGQTPLFNTNPQKLEERAKEKLSEGGWYYASSNAGLSNTHLANRQSFYRHRIIPNQLVDTNSRDTSAEIFGHRVSAPIGFAPIGINKIYHPAGEAAVSKVAGELNLPYCLSTAGSTSIEKVAEANGSGPRFYQLYMPHDDELTLSLLNRAWNAGFDALILTTDTWQLGWRHDDVATSNYAFYRGFGADLGLTDPVFRKRCQEDGIDPDKDVVAASTKWIDSVWHGRAWSWEKIPWLIEQWKKISGGRPFAIKGIQSVKDAKKCVELGVDGIVVSNHAGRQVDGAVASLDALEKIVEAVGEKIYIMFDSGVRGASDVVKALALGAKFVFVGRLWIWGLSIMGEDGVRHVMKSLLADLDILMGVAGFNSVKDFEKEILESGPKSYSLIPEKVL